MNFTDLALSESIQDGLKDIQFTSPTPIQQACIPEILAGRDMIATAQTGTGKTGAFAIPILERVLQSDRKGVKALILSPTRELALQIEEQIYAIGYHAGITTASVIGGSDFGSQMKALKGGVDIVVATPGRLMDQKKVSNLDFSTVEFFVLDEADRMLDMGFFPDIRKIISWLPERRQNLLFSATMPEEIVRLTSAFMQNPATVNIARSSPSKNVSQYLYELSTDQKIHVVKELLHQIKWESVIIFTSTKRGTDQLQRLLRSEGIPALSIHGDRSQDERNKALQDFISGKVPVIVATDVLARGIDIKGVSMIINFDMPNNTDDYVHRVGRTGRYDRTGVAVTFATRRDAKAVKEVMAIKENEIIGVVIPEAYSGKGALDLKLKADMMRAPDEQRAAFDGSRGNASRPAAASETQAGEGRGERQAAPARDDRGPRPEPRDRQRQDAQPPRQDRGRQGREGEPRHGRAEGEQPRRGPAPTHSRGDGSAPHGVARSAEAANEPAIAILDKAIERSSRYPRPAKGLRGILVSLFPAVSRR